MYIPEHFRLPDEHVRRLLGTARPGNLVTVHADGPDATLVPFYFDETANQMVTHLVRNNPQATTPLAGPALVILDEADAYVSPLWYATNDALANVPTWDYLTIHIRGAMHVDASPEASLAVARELTKRMETRDVLSPVGEEKLARMARSIVSVRIDVERIDAKAKMSQNRHPDDITSLAEELERQGETELVAYLREVSLPHAVARHAMINDLRSGRKLAEGITAAR